MERKWWWGEDERGNQHIEEEKFANMSVRKEKGVSASLREGELVPPLK